AGAEAAARGKGTEASGRKVSQASSRQDLEPLPTKDEPTFIRVANTQKPMPVRLDRHALLRLESDAPDAYLSKHVHAKLTLGSEPEDVLTMESRSDFQGGRARMTIRPTSKAKNGQTGTVTVFLFTPDDKQHSAKI